MNGSGAKPSNFPPGYDATLSQTGVLILWPPSSPSTGSPITLHLARTRVPTERRSVTLADRLAASMIFRLGVPAT